MKKILALILSAMLLVSVFPVVASADTPTFSEGYYADVNLQTGDITAPGEWGAVPNDAQRYYQKQGLSAFCHFGPNTFQNLEWGESYGTRSPAELFTLSSDFDADNIVRMLKEAGFCRLILTCKHHDGFAIWDCSEVYEKYGLKPYTIAQTNYKQGKGDILAELSDACTRYNMDMGIYLSPWDIHMQNEGVFGSTVKSDGTPVDTNSAGQPLTYQNKYNDFYIDQIKSILYAVKTDEDGNEITDSEGNPVYKYGNNNPERRSDRFVEMWMDGATGNGAAAQYYNWQRIFETVREENPGCQIFGTNKAGENDNTDNKIFDSLSNTGGIHWIGNENGVASSTTWSKLNAGSPGYEDKTAYPRVDGAIVGKEDGDIWSVPECDTKMLSGGWFWGAGKQSSLRSMENLAEIYFSTIGNGAVLLMNASPNTEGVLDTNQFSRFEEFGRTIKETFGVDFTKAEGVAAAANSVYGNNVKYSASKVIDNIPEGEDYDDTYWAPESGHTTGSIEINLGEAKTFDIVSIEEYIALGQRISGFTVEYKTVGGTWKNFGSGTTIGAKKLVRNTPVIGTAIRINITESKALPMINNVGVFKAASDFELHVDDGLNLPTELENYEMIPHTDADKQGTWKDSNTSTDPTPTHSWSNAADASQTYTFTGSQFLVKANLDPGHSGMKITIDGDEEGSITVDTHADSRSMEEIVYVSDELDYEEHTVKLTTLTNTTTNKSCNDIYGIYVLDNEGKGVINVEKKEYRTCSNSTQKVKIVRSFGSAGEMSFNYATATGSAEQNVGYKYKEGTLTFEAGQTEIEVNVETLYNKERGNDDALYFYFALYPNGDEPVYLGKNISPKIYIEPIDLDTTTDDIRTFLRNSVLYDEEYYEDTEAYELYTQRVQEAEEVLKNSLTTSTEVDKGAALKELELAYAALNPNVSEAVVQNTLTVNAENSHDNTPAGNAIDGNPNTNWHTLWANDSGTKPNFETNVGNSFFITLSEPKQLISFTYLPRQDTSSNGIILGFELFYSANENGEDWQLIEKGTWENDHTLKTVEIPNLTVKRLKLRANTTAGDTANAFISAAELNVYYSVAEPLNKETDNSELGEKITAGQNIAEGKNYAFLESAITAAQAVQSKANATQKEIDDATYAIECAVYKIDLQEKIVQAQASLDESESSTKRNALDAAIETADALLENSGATQPEIKESIEALEKAIAMTDVEKAPLEAKIAEAEEALETAVTTEKRSALRAAIAAANTVLENDKATEEEVNSAIADLETAIDMNDVDKAPLEAKIAEAEEALETVETEFKRNALNEAITAANAILEKEDATQEEVDSAIEALTAAIEMSDVTPFVLGDVNHDGAIDAGDATLALQRYAGIIGDDYEKYDPSLADVNGDSNVDAGDATLMLQKYAGIVSVFPAANKGN